MWAPMRALRAGSQEDNASKRFPVDVATPDFESRQPTEISYQYKFDLQYGPRCTLGYLFSFETPDLPARPLQMQRLSLHLQRGSLQSGVPLEEARLGRRDCVKTLLRRQRGIPSAGSRKCNENRCICSEILLQMQRDPVARATRSRCICNEMNTGLCPAQGGSVILFEGKAYEFDKGENSHIHGHI